MPPTSAPSGLATANVTSESVLDLTPLAFGSSPEQKQLLPTPTTVSPSSVPSQIGDLPLPLLALAGSVTTLFTDVIMHPIDCIKILQQSDAGYGLSLQDAAVALWERDGVSGFYSGFLTYAVSDAAGGALKFAVWELWKRQMQTPSSTTAPSTSTSPTFDVTSSLWFQWGYLFVGAALAFVASSVAIVPGEYVKNQLQMDRYDGLTEAVTGIMASRGIPGFFVGYDAVMYRDVPYTMLELGLYEVFKTALFSSQSSSDSSKPRSVGVWDDVLAAALTGGITAFLTTPLDVIKTKLMVDDAYAGYSFLDCWLATVESHGIGSVFAGVVARIAWILPFVTIYLPTYDFLKRLLWQRQVQNIQR